MRRRKSDEPEEFHRYKPAPGYPALPDHTAKDMIWNFWM